MMEVQVLLVVGAFFYFTMSANCIPRRKCSGVWCAAYECQNAFEETGSFVFQISNPAVALSRVFTVTRPFNTRTFRYQGTSVPYGTVVPKCPDTSGLVPKCFKTVQYQSRTVSNVWVEQRSDEVNSLAEISHRLRQSWANTKGSRCEQPSSA